MAAWRIAAAWRSYVAGPHHAARTFAAMTLQAGWRGELARRRSGQLRVRRDALSALETAIAVGDLDAVRSCSAAAQAVGAAEEATAMSDAFKAAVKATVLQLQSAATSGDFAAYAAAAAAAGAYPHLSAVAADCELRFSRRRDALLDQLRVASETMPLAQVLALAAPAAELGLPEVRLADAVRAARERDARARAALASAASAELFLRADLDAALAVCDGLGLGVDVAAAKLAVQQRQRQAAAALAAAGAHPTTEPAALQLLVAQARELGLAEEADAAEQLQRTRKVSLEAQLQLAAEEGTATDVACLMEQASGAGVGQEALSRASGHLAARQRAARHALQLAASEGSLEEYTRACERAMGVEARGHEQADLLLRARQRDAARKLQATATEACARAAAASDAAAPGAAEELCALRQYAQRLLGARSDSAGEGGPCVSTKRAPAAGSGRGICSASSPLVGEPGTAGLDAQGAACLGALAASVQEAARLGLGDNLEAAATALLEQCSAVENAGGLQAD